MCPLTGLSRVTHEHLAVALALEVPVAVVITKADVAPPEAAQQVLQDIRYTLCCKLINTPIFSLACCIALGLLQHCPIEELTVVFK